MREIKFRAWDGKEKIMWINIHLTDIYSDDGSNGYSADMIKNGELQKYLLFWNYYDKHIVWMQYTGLKDKNGKEIYEGDIVQFKSDEVVENFEVRWDEDWAGFRIDASYLATWNLDLIEVVGNIYENPRLLSKLNKEKK